MSEWRRCKRCDRVVFGQCSCEPAPSPSPVVEVSEEMVNAAAEEYCARTGETVTSDDMRAALIAAVKVAK